MADSLRVLRAQIKREARYIGRKPLHPGYIVESWIGQR